MANKACSASYATLMACRSFRAAEQLPTAAAHLSPLVSLLPLLLLVGAGSSRRRDRAGLQQHTSNDESKDVGGGSKRRRRRSGSCRRRGKSMWGNNSQSVLHSGCVSSVASGVLGRSVG